MTYEAGARAEILDRIKDEFSSDPQYKIGDEWFNVRDVAGQLGVSYDKAYRLLKSKEQRGEVESMMVGTRLKWYRFIESEVDDV